MSEYMTELIGHTLADMTFRWHHWPDSGREAAYRETMKFHQTLYQAYPNDVRAIESECERVLHTMEPSRYPSQETIRALRA